MGSSTSHHAWYDARREIVLWTGLLTGPLAWLTLLETQYVLSYVACETRQTWFLYVPALLAVGLVAVAGWSAWSAGPGRADQRVSPPVTRATTESRARWMGLCGAVLCAWFVLVILAMQIPVVTLDPCQ